MGSIKIEKKFTRDKTAIVFLSIFKNIAIKRTIIFDNLEIILKKIRTTLVRKLFYEKTKLQP